MALSDEDADLKAEKMTWAYRIVRHKDGSHALHEVHYADDTPWARTENPCTFAVDAEENPKVIIEMLEMALKDIKDRTAIGDEWFDPEIQAIK